MSTIHIKFNIEYYTRWGQQVCICGSIPELGNRDENKAIELSTTDGHNWGAEITIRKTKTIEYYYFIREAGTTTRREWGKWRLLKTGGKKMFSIKDHWKDKPFHQYLYSSVFIESVFAHKKTILFLHTKMAIYYSMCFVLMRRKTCNRLSVARAKDWAIGI
jgi:4-alpha-glucanotransferase